ncbi:MAG: adenosylcobinamide-GDP ribazoletransferase [Verrucomicrobiota bacterium]|nr:adenosylcobinamide-GDP ribazoletransferase [Verrucomicrobiota bacterium]
MIRRECAIFLAAVTYFTRIRIPWIQVHSEELLNKATRYFPMIGWIVGGFAALIFWLAVQVWPVTVAVLISTVASILLTGAFHEDGWTDMCDAFGGGWTKDQILSIMKDSRIGAYGTIGIVLILGIKVIALSEMPVHWIPLVLIAGHSMSRLAATFQIYLLTYVRENEDSKSKPIAKKMTLQELVFAVVTGFLPLFLMPSFAWVILPMAVAWCVMSRIFVKKIGGYTGDCLGATQQICETVFYLGCLAGTR